MRIEKSPIKHIYIHYPFCRSKCGYCSFYSINHDLELEREYFAILNREIDIYRQRFEIQAETIYLGGGTPSLSAYKELNDLLSGLRARTTKEVTLEVNPADVTVESVVNWKEMGINRISMGCQSMLDTELELLGRRHRKATVEKAVDFIRNADIDNLSLDLMYGLPFQKKGSLLRSLRSISKLMPDHISAYCLTLSEDCEMKDYRSAIPDDKIVSEMYYKIIDILEKRDFRQYELSNFCRTGKESLHNLAYWKGRYYLGAGPSASGYFNGLRYSNESDLANWKESIQRNILFPKKDLMDKSKEEKEFIFLSLRMKQGIKLESYRQKFGFNFKDRYNSQLTRYLDLGLMDADEQSVIITKKGYFISNEILKDFV